jgi:hypothetical protein
MMNGGKQNSEVRRWKGRASGWGALARLQMADSRFQKAEFRKQKAEGRSKKEEDSS